MTLLRYISTLYVGFFCIILFVSLFESRHPARKTLTLTLSLMLPLLAINFILLYIFGPETMSTLLLATCSIPSLIFFWFLAKHRDGRFFFTFCAVDTLMLDLLCATSVLDFFIGNTYVFMFASRILICPILAYICNRWLRPIYLDMQNKVHRGWYTFTLISVIFYILLPMAMSVPTMITQRLDQLPAFVLLLVLMPVLYFHIFNTLRHQQKVYESSEQENILNIQVSNMRLRIEELSEAYDNSRMERHNFRHKMRAIAGLVEREQYSELRTLVMEYNDAIKETQVKRYCRSAVIDAVLSAYIRKAESHGINVSTALSFPEDIPVNEAELATVFANAIENAINACEKLDEARRELDIKVLSSPRFMIQLSNSYNGKVEFGSDGVPVSHEEGHGFGTRSIAAFCDKHGAFYEFKADGEMFRLRIMFP